LYVGTPHDEESLIFHATSSFCDGKFVPIHTFHQVKIELQLKYEDQLTASLYDHGFGYHIHTLQSLEILNTEFSQLSSTVIAYSYIHENNDHIANFHKTGLSVAIHTFHKS
jgi:hypothetical protein